MNGSIYFKPYLFFFLPLFISYEVTLKSCNYFKIKVKKKKKQDNQAYIKKLLNMFTQLCDQLV